MCSVFFGSLPLCFLCTVLVLLSSCVFLSCLALLRFQYVIVSVFHVYVYVSCILSAVSLFCPLLWSSPISLSLSLFSPAFCESLWDQMNGKLGTTSKGFSTTQQVRIGETCMWTAECDDVLSGLWLEVCGCPWLHMYQPWEVKEDSRKNNKRN